MVGKVLLAFAVDAAAGEPPQALHPVRWMGMAVAVVDRAAPRGAAGPTAEKLAGVVTALALPAGVYMASRALVRTLPRPLAGAAEVALLWVSLAGRSLYEGGLSVQEGLDEGIGPGREAVSQLVGRDTGSLDEAGVVRAAVESVAENTNDGVVAPLFYGFLGGAPLVLAYKMINTLDSMIGYKNRRHGDFGWAAARVDDAAGYLPARLTALAVAVASPLAGGNAAPAWDVWRREAAAHESPNAGVCEAAFAGALGVRLGGANVYGGRRKETALLGRDFAPPVRGDIGRAARLMYAAAALFLGVGAVCCVALGRAGSR